MNDMWMRQYLRRWPSRRRDVCHGESSYRYPLRINGAHEQLNLFPIAQLGQPVWPPRMEIDDYGIRVILWILIYIQLMKNCKLPEELWCHHIPLPPTSARERAWPLFSDCDRWLCRWLPYWLLRPRCKLQIEKNFD